MELTIGKLIDEVAKEFNVTAEEIKGRSKRRPYPECRQILCFIAKDIFSSQTIYAAISIDHSQLNYNLRKCREEIEVYTERKNQYRRIMKSIDHEIQI